MRVQASVINLKDGCSIVARSRLCAAARALSEAKVLMHSGQDFGEDRRARSVIDAAATIGLSHCAPPPEGRDATYQGSCIVDSRCVGTPQARRRPF